MVALALFRRSSALALVVALLTAAVPPAFDAASFAALRTVDRRLAVIAYRLTTANAALCTELTPQPGLALHTIAQYDPGLRETARAVFGFAAPVAVEVVVPGSAAERAGVREDDGLLAVGGAALATQQSSQAADSASRDAAQALIAAQPATAPLRLELIRKAERRAVRIPASPGCRSSFEVLLGPKMTAQSDGALVQIGVRFFERYTDAEVAVVAAHELAHSILRHRARLEAAGVKGGLLAEVGRNGRLNRMIEDQADLLGVHLLRNAGYDPSIAPAFWRAHGGEIDGGLFRARTHRSSSARADRLTAEIAAIPPRAPVPYLPPVLTTRDQPLQ